MGTTQGFQLVAEVQRAFALQVAQGAWDNSIIPHSKPLPANAAFGPYQISQGTVNIPRQGIGVNMVPAQNAVQLVLGQTHIQVQIANPPVPSATMFDMMADIDVTLPVGTLPNTINIGLIVDNLPRANVTVNLTSGDPIGPITLSSIQDYVDAQYQNNTIPHAITQNGVSFGAFAADAYAQIDDDPTDPANQIQVTQPDANHVTVSIPVHLKLVNVKSGNIPVPSPIGVETRVDLTTQLTAAPGSTSANVGQAQIAVEAIAADPAVANNQYATDKSLAQTLYGINLDTLLSQQIQAYAQQIAAAIGNITIVVPTLDQIETFIGDQVYHAVLAGGDIGIWTPQAGNNPQVTIQNATPQVLSDALAIAINSESGANAAALTSFIPSGRMFALAIDGSFVLSIIQQTIDKPQSQGGLGGVPSTQHNVDGHDVKLNSLSTSLQEGSIHFEGNCTVPNAIAGHIDVSADFHADASMTWVNNPDGSQSIQPVDLGSGVSIGVLAWIVSLLLGFISGGLIGGIIAIVVMEVATGIANKIGGALIQNDITKQVTGIGAWPQTLEGIGTVTASFQNPIDIHADCVIFSG